jgi:nucleoside-diphosphate-sugar epimerase
VNAVPTGLVTGGAGFIGSHLAERLVRLGHRVRVVDNLSTGDRRNLGSFENEIELVEGDLRDPAVCARAVAGIDTVWHVAALPSVPRSLADPIACHEHNVNATVNLLLACRSAGVRRLVYSSSSSVYGDTPTLPKVETMEPRPMSPYAAAKLAAEQYVLAFARAGLIEGIALRYFNVFGPRQRPDSAYAAVIPVWMAAARDGGAATVHGDGGQTRDFTFVANVIEANLLAGTLPATRVSGWVTNVGAGCRETLSELLALVRQVTGSPLPVVHSPPRAGDVRDSLAGLDRVAEVLGYRPAVLLEEGLERTWEWFCGVRPTV